MSDRTSVWGELTDFVASSTGKFLESISGFAPLAAKSTKEVDINLDELHAGSHHNLRASDFGYLEPEGENVHKETLGNRLFLTPEEREQGKYIGNEWDYSDRIGNHLPRVPMDLLERRFTPDLDCGVQSVSYLQRARELVIIHKCLLLDAEDMIELRNRHLAKPKDSFLSRLITSFNTSRKLGKDGLSLIFAGTPIVAMGGEQRRFIALNWNPPKNSYERILREGWETGHVGVDSLIEGHAFILTLPPFKERRSSLRGKE